MFDSGTRLSPYARERECCRIVDGHPFRLLSAALWILVLGFSPTEMTHASEVPFGVRDYFRLQRVGELALSSSGDWLAYAVNHPSLEDNSTTQQVFIRSLNVESTAMTFAGLDDARGLQWIPHTQHLAFLSTHSGSAQVYSVDTSDGALRQWTHAGDPVQSFVFSSKGDLAYITRPPTKNTAAVVDLIKSSNAGVVINTREVSFRDFLPGVHSHIAPSGMAKLWLSRSGHPVTLVDVPGDVQQIHWSTDTRRLSVIYIGSDIPQSLARKQLSTLAVVNVASHRLQILFKGHDIQHGESAVGYVGGEWVPGKEQVLVRRLSQDNIWLREHFPDWAFTSADARLRGPIQWHPFEEYNAKYAPMTLGVFLAEDVENGVGSLYRVEAGGSKLSEIVGNTKGYSSRFTFSADNTRAAFVNESLDRPPEIFLWQQRDGAVRQFTHLNGELAALQLPRVSELHWKSKDGVDVSGYLLEPFASDAGPHPLVTLVHGGPCGVFVNKFASFFPFWPFPIEVMPAYGISVLVPNYRGTCSFGRRFQSASDDGGEPIDDILTGINYLVANGIADQGRLGIMGHSHGGWLAPMIMTRSKLFRVGSFAEGWSNSVLLYELQDEHLDRDVLDVTTQGSLYSNAHPYLEQSPDLHMDGVHTAMLIEDGDLTGDALLMFPLAKAGDRLGLPTESVVYPHTDHNIVQPRTQLESANRNLDWFRFWLLGEEDSVPAKIDQYLRWRKMLAPPGPIAKLDEFKGPNPN